MKKRWKFHTSWLNFDWTLAVYLQLAVHWCSQMTCPCVSPLTISAFSRNEPFLFVFTPLLTLCSKSANFTSTPLLFRWPACVASCGRDHILKLLLCARKKKHFWKKSSRMPVNDNLFLFVLPVQEAGKESDQSDLAAEQDITRLKDQGPHLQCRFPARDLVTHCEGQLQSLLNTLKSYSLYSQWQHCPRSLSGRSVHFTQPQFNCSNNTSNLSTQRLHGDIMKPFSTQSKSGLLTLWLITC